jgi:hypothetical protein
VADLIGRLRAEGLPQSAEIRVRPICWNEPFRREFCECWLHPWVTLEQNVLPKVIGDKETIMKRAMNAFVIAAALASGPASEIPPAAKPAADVLSRYLELVKARNWAEAKKLIHDKTLDAIAQRKKRLGDEDHPMAPWYYEKEQYWLKAYRLTGVREGPGGTWIFETSEDNYYVQEKGIAEGDPAAYLVGKSKGRWVIADKKRGMSFTDDSVKYGYKGYFDKDPEEKVTRGAAQ